MKVSYAKVMAMANQLISLKGIDWYKLNHIEDFKLLKSKGLLPSTMKRSSLKKKSNTKIKKLKDGLWDVFKVFIKKRDKGVCFTCEAVGCEGRNYHAGHFVPDSVGGVLLRYHEDNVHGQCMRCNIHLGGWGERYAVKMEEKYGREFVDKLRSLKYVTAKWSEEDYLNKIKYYEELVSQSEISTPH